MIRKPPGGRPALWHQDHAYWQPELDYYALGVWLPMHDVHVEMGAMQFIPGSHKRGLLQHRHGDEPQHNVLVVDEPFDVSKAVPCPLKMGGATFHHSRNAALHRAEHHESAAAGVSRWNSRSRRCGAKRRSTCRGWNEFRKATGGPHKLMHVADGRVSEL